MLLDRQILPRNFFLSIFIDGAESGVDQEVHATAGREAGATGSQPISTVHAIGNRLYTNR